MSCYETSHFKPQPSLVLFWPDNFTCVFVIMYDLGMLGMCRTVFHENPTESYTQELVFSNFPRTVLANESTDLHLTYKTPHTTKNMFLWTCHSTPSTSDLFVTKHSLPWYHFEENCSLLLQAVGLSQIQQYSLIKCSVSLQELPLFP